MRLRGSTTVEEDHNTVARKGASKGMEVVESKNFSFEPLHLFIVVVVVVKGGYGLLTLSKSPLWPYPCFYINRFYVDDLIKQGSIESKE